MTVDNKKLQQVIAEADAKYGKWAWQYMVDMYNNWASLEQVRNVMKNYNSNSTSTNSNSNKWYTNLTQYTALTWDTPAGPSTKWTASDLSYMQPTNYYSSWNKWDKSIDITHDYNRAKEMAYNIKQDMITNPKLFTNRDDYNKYYNYEWSHPSQQKLLDEFFANANKYWLWATDNFYADMASQASTDKNQKLLNKAANTYNKMMPYLNEIRNTINGRLTPLFDTLLENQTKYLEDMAYLRKLQMQYNRDMKEASWNRAAGQAASMWSMMSWQWLSQSAIASSMMWAEKTWVEELNSIQDQHINRMKELSDAEKDFQNNYVNMVQWLTTSQVNMLNNWYNSFKTLQDWLDTAYNNMIKEQYSPYEVLTQAKVTWWAETLQSTWKADVKQSEYQWANSTKKRSIIYNQLYWLLSSDPTTFAKFTPYITTAVEQYPNDWEKAVTYVLEKWWVKQDTAVKVIEKIVEWWQWWGWNWWWWGWNWWWWGGWNNYDDASNIISILGLK